MMVNAARMMVTIQKRMVIFDSWKQLRGFFHRYLQSVIQLIALCAEVVVDRCALEDTLLHTSPLSYLVIVNLHHHAEAFYEENTAEDRQHQLLVDDDGACDDTADGQRTRIAHEYLGRVGVVPEETDEAQ